MKIFVLKFILLLLLAQNYSFAHEREENRKQNHNTTYSVYNSFEELLLATDAKYFEPERISPVGTRRKPMYHGFFFYNCTHDELFQFDPTGRYMLALRIFIEGRKVQPHDRGEVGYFDLQRNNKWIKIGETTAWNWQQGTRLQWIPGSSDEIVWNDRSEDGKILVSRIYNMKTT